MSDVVERAKAALEGVSRAPWKMGNRTHPDVVHTPNGCLWHPILGEINHRADGEFIAQARTLVPELVAELERARDLITEFRKRDESATRVIERLKAREDTVAEASYRTGQLDAEASR